MIKRNQLNMDKVPKKGKRKIKTSADTNEPPQPKTTLPIISTPPSNLPLPSTSLPLPSLPSISPLTTNNLPKVDSSKKKHDILEQTGSLSNVEKEKDKLEFFRQQEAERVEKERIEKER